MQNAALLTKQASSRRDESFQSRAVEAGNAGAQNEEGSQDCAKASVYMHGMKLLSSSYCQIQASKTLDRPK